MLEVAADRDAHESAEGPEAESKTGEPGAVPRPVLEQPGRWAVGKRLTVDLADVEDVYSLEADQHAEL